MFRERYLIQMSGHGSSGGGHAEEGGIVQKLAKAVSPLEEKEDVYKNLLHNNAISGKWNDKMIESAREASVNIMNVGQEIRKELKAALWEHPKGMVKSLLKSLSKPIFSLPAWAWTKVLQPVGNVIKLATSGLLVTTAEAIEKVETAPAKLMLATGKKIDSAIDKLDELGGGGHGHSAAHH